MFKKILTFGFAFIIGITTLGIGVAASPRAVREVYTEKGYGYKYYTTNHDYEMITNGNDNGIWIKVGTESEGKLYQYEKAVGKLRDMEDNLLEDGLSYSDLHNFLNYLIDNDMFEATNILKTIYTVIDKADKQARDAKQRLDLVIDWYDSLLPYEAPESKNDCVWNGGAWICKYMEGDFK